MTGSDELYAHSIVLFLDIILWGWGYIGAARAQPPWRGDAVPGGALATFGVAFPDVYGRLGHRRLL